MEKANTLKEIINYFLKEDPTQYWPNELTFGLPDIDDPKVNKDFYDTVMNTNDILGDQKGYEYIRDFYDYKLYRLNTPNNNKIIDVLVKDDKIILEYSS